jgi:hypothetical protein
MLHKHTKDGKRAPHKRTYNCCSLTSFVTCIIDLEDFCNNVFDDSLTILHTSMMVKIGGTLVNTLWMGGVGAWTEGGTNTSASSGYDTSVGVGVGTSIRVRCKILVDGNIGMLLWGSMATCVKEGLGISSEGGAFTTIGELVCVWGGGGGGGKKQGIENI